MLGCDYPKTHVRHLEAPVQPSLCADQHAHWPDGSDRTVPIEDWCARWSSEPPRSGAAILTSTSAYIKGVRFLLAESETANVVRLPPHRSP